MAFQVQVQLTAEKPTERVILVGSHEAFGSWVPERGIELEWQHSAWVTKRPITLPPASVECKFLRLSERGHVEWESGPNRILEIPRSNKAGEMQLRGKFNGDGVLSKEVLPNKAALKAEKTAALEAAQAAAALEARKRDHAEKVETQRKEHVERQAQRSETIAQMHQQLEEARQELEKLCKEEQQLAAEVAEAVASKIALSYTTTAPSKGAITTTTTTTAGDDFEADKPSELAAVDTTNSVDTVSADAPPIESALETPVKPSRPGRQLPVRVDPSTSFVQRLRVDTEAAFACGFSSVTNTAVSTQQNYGRSFSKSRFHNQHGTSTSGAQPSGNVLPVRPRESTAQKAFSSKSRQRAPLSSLSSAVPLAAHRQEPHSDDTSSSSAAGQRGWEVVNQGDGGELRWGLRAENTPPDAQSSSDEAPQAANSLVASPALLAALQSAADKNPQADGNASAGSSQSGDVDQSHDQKLSQVTDPCGSSQD